MAAVVEAAVEDALQLLPEGGVFDGDDCFDAGGEVAGHPVGAADEVEWFAIVDEGVDAVVLEEAANHADHFDVFAEPFDTGLDAAVAAHDKADGNAGLTGAVEGADDDGVIEPVHFGYDAGGAAGKGVGGLGVDQLYESVLHVDRGNEEAAEVALAAVSREKVEEVHEVGADFGTGGEQAEVGV